MSDPIPLASSSPTGQPQAARNDIYTDTRKWLDLVLSKQKLSLVQAPLPYASPFLWWFLPRKRNDLTMIQEQVATLCKLSSEELQRWPTTSVIRRWIKKSRDSAINELAVSPVTSFRPFPFSPGTTAYPLQTTCWLASTLQIPDVAGLEGVAVDITAKEFESLVLNALHGPQPAGGTSYARCAPTLGAKDFSRAPVKRSAEAPVWSNVPSSRTRICLSDDRTATLDKGSDGSDASRALTSSVNDAELGNPER